MGKYTQSTLLDVMNNNCEDRYLEIATVPQSCWNAYHSEVSTFWNVLEYFVNVYKDSVMW